MDTNIYFKEDYPEWGNFVADKFAGFLYKAYKGEDLPATKDKHWIAHETIDSDVIISLENRKDVVGLTSVKFVGNIAGYKKPIYIREIAVRIEDRGKGISKKLRGLMLEKLHPDLILGVAHNPISVISRANFFDRQGFQTYWGNLPVGKYPDEKESPEIDGIGKKFVSNEFPKLSARYGSGILPYVDANIWATKEDVGNKKIAVVLSKILSFQKEYNTPAMATLISLKP